METGLEILQRYRFYNLVNHQWVLHSMNTPVTDHPDIKLYRKQKTMCGIKCG